jgi:RHS repeat-associated protein
LASTFATLLTLTMLACAVLEGTRLITGQGRSWIWAVGFVCGWPLGVRSSARAASRRMTESRPKEPGDGTGLQFNRARHHKASYGAFIEPDPLGIPAGSANLYQYAYGAPLDFLDPSGELGFSIPIPDPVEIAGSAASAAVGAAASAGNFAWEHKVEIGAGAVAGACIFASAGLCTGAAVVSFGLSTVDNIENADCRPFLQSQLITVASTAVVGLRGVLPRAMGSTFPSLPPAGQAGRWALNTPPAAAGLGASNYIEPGAQDYYSGGATSSC